MDEARDITVASSWQAGGDHGRNLEHEWSLPCPDFLPQEAGSGTLTFQSGASEDFFLGVGACLVSLLVQQNKAWSLGINSQSLKSPLPFLPKKPIRSLMQIGSLGTVLLSLRSRCLMYPSPPDFYCFTHLAISLICQLHFFYKYSQ